MTFYTRPASNCQCTSPLACSRILHFSLAYQIYSLNVCVSLEAAAKLVPLKDPWYRQSGDVKVNLVETQPVNADVVQENWIKKWYNII